MKSKTRLPALLLLLLAAPLVLALGPAPYPAGPVSFAVYPPEPGAVRPGERFRYRFSWNGIQAAQAVWETKPAPNRPGWLYSRADGTIVGTVAALFSANDYLASCLRADTFKPETYTVRIRESLDYYDMSVGFNHRAGIASRTRTTRSLTAAKTYEFSNAYCPVGTALLIRSLPWKTGDERRFEVIDGNDRYLLVVRGGAIENLTVPAGAFRAIRLEPSIFRLPGERSRETARYWQRQRVKDQGRTANMTSFAMWMQLDPPRAFLKVRTDVFFGHVDMELVEMSVPQAP